MIVLRRATAVLVAAVTALVLAVLGATPALAHAALEKSTPAQGAVLTVAPTTVSLTFAEAVTVDPNPIRVTGPGGVAWTLGPATVKGDTVSAPVTATGPAGAYTMAWSVVSDDDDKVSGRIAFTLNTPATPPTTAAPTTAPTTAPATTAPATTAPATTAQASAAAATSVAPAAAAAPPDSGGGVPVWVWVLVAVVVLGAIGAVVARSRRSSGS